MASSKPYLCVLLAACSGRVDDHGLSPGQVELSAEAAAVGASDAPAFADERGGGVFVAEDGRALRLRRDGSEAPLESHPGNDVPAGKASAVYPAGPYSALVTTDSGLYVAEDGWLIAPPFRDALSPEGFVAATLGADGVVWIAHESGVYRLQDGALSALTRAGNPITGVQAIAAGPADDGSNGLWISDGQRLWCARQTARTRYALVEAELAADALSSGVVGLVSLSSAPDAPGELWLATPKGLWRRTAEGFRVYVVPFVPTAMLARGRFLWLASDAGLLRYDADDGSWREVRGAPAGARLLAVDPSGSAYVRSPDGTLLELGAPAARLCGLFEGQRISGAELVLSADVLASDAPTSVTFALDDGETITRSHDDAQVGSGVLATLSFSLAGFAPSGSAQGFDLTGMSPGLHTLTVSVTDGTGERMRRVHFELVGGDGAPVSFAADVQPIVAARCAKCHGAGSAHPLDTYARWLAEQAAILRALGEQRMPADGPLDPAELRTLQRWASTGASP